MISLSHISKQYGRQLLFVDTSVQLNPGEKVGLVGPNGAGKTTLFRMIVGEEAPELRALGADFSLESQTGFEANTGTLRDTVVNRSDGQVKILDYRLARSIAVKCSETTKGPPAGAPDLR